jgi:hypothetical protein
MMGKFFWVETHKRTVTPVFVTTTTGTLAASPSRKLIGEPLNLFQKFDINQNFHTKTLSVVCVYGCPDSVIGKDTDARKGSAHTIFGVPFTGWRFVVPASD